MAAKDEKKQKYIIYARNTETMKEGYAVVGMHKVPFEKPVYLSPKQVDLIERQKEAIQMDAPVSVKDIMEKHQISQSKAMQIAKQKEADPDTRKKITFVSKYIVSKA